MNYLVLFTLFYSNVIFAEADIGGRFISKITSLTSDESQTNTLKLARPSDGYNVEVEREIEGHGGPERESEIPKLKTKARIGVDIISGLNFIDSKKVKSKEEIKIIEKKNPLSFFKAENALKMTKDEVAQFNFIAGIVFAPSIGNISVWNVVNGGWDLTVTKLDDSVVKMDFALIDTKKSFTGLTKYRASLSYGFIKHLVNGVELTLNLKDPTARLAYEKIFKGNILFAQKESLTNANIILENRKKKKERRKGFRFLLKTPYVSWFVEDVNVNQGGTEEVTYSYDEKKSEKIISESLESEYELDFFNNHGSRNRSFETSYNTSSGEYELKDTYEIESNVGTSLNEAASIMLNKTLMNEFFEFNVPDVKNNYYRLALEIKYSESFFKHLISEKFDIDSLERKANSFLNLYYDNRPFALSEHLNPIQDLVQPTIDKKLIDLGISDIKEKTEEMRTHFENNDIRNSFKSFNEMMKSIYRSPALYKAFVEYSKRCGTEINFLRESEAYAKKEVHKAYLTDSRCAE